MVLLQIPNVGNDTPSPAPWQVCKALPRRCDPSPRLDPFSSHSLNRKRLSPIVPDSILKSGLREERHAEIAVCAARVGQGTGSGYNEESASRRGSVSS